MSRVFCATCTIRPQSALYTEALESVRAQTRPMYHIWIGHNGHNYAPEGVHPPSFMFNQILDMLRDDDYLCMLCDDDVLYPDYCETLAGYLDTHPEAQICYGGIKHILYDSRTGESRHVRDLPADLSITFGPDRMPCYEIGYLSVMYRVSMLRALGARWPERAPEPITRISDGLLLNQIAEHYNIPSVGRFVATARITEASSHTRLTDGWGVEQHDWRAI